MSSNKQGVYKVRYAGGLIESIKIADEHAIIDNVNNAPVGAETIDRTELMKRLSDDGIIVFTHVCCEKNSSCIPIKIFDNEWIRTISGDGPNNRDWLQGVPEF